jgi:hypothetical protein
MATPIQYNILKINYSKMKIFCFSPKYYIFISSWVWCEIFLFENHKKYSFFKNLHFLKTTDSEKWHFLKFTVSKHTQHSQAPGPPPDCWAPVILYHLSPHSRNTSTELLMKTVRTTFYNSSEFETRWFYTAYSFIRLHFHEATNFHSLHVAR